MKNNRFYQNKKAIQHIGKSRGVDVNTACTMLAKEKGWKNWQHELDVFNALCKGYVRAKYGPNTKYMDHDGDGDVDLNDLFEE